MPPTEKPEIHKQ